MVKLRLRYVIEDVDRHGNVRLYFRRKGRPKIRLTGLPGTEEFINAYQAAMANNGEAPRQTRSVARGSFRYVCQAYFASPSFKALDSKTRNWRRRALDSICEKHADKPVALMRPKHVRALRDERADTPGAANIRLKALRALFRWAVEADEAPHDPTRDVSKIQYRPTGFHSWSMEEVEAYEKHHSVGTKARLAMAILLYTACRREDAVRLGLQHIRNGRAQYVQAKNEHRSPVSIDIPVHTDLAAIIGATPSGHLTLLATEYGRPFTPAGFGNAFKDWCRQANLPHCSAHGLRKAMASRLAERGATAHQIMSVTGHRSLEEVERYTRAARQAKLADSAMEKLKGEH
jgi:integrase/recombinase XerD